MTVLAFLFSFRQKPGSDSDQPPYNGKIVYDKHTILMKFYGERITDQLTALPIEVITTHVHTDHIGSHGEFEEIYVHEGDRDWLINGIKDLSIEQIRKEVSIDITLPIPKIFNLDTSRPF